MGSLTRYLQREFERLCPEGWTANREVALLPSELEALLGYAPRADVLLERRDGSRRLWIEFEVSRADPVANHAKFATAHLFQPQASTDTFVAMVSSHVARGRRNLAANAVSLMRHVGMSAFQTVLFPHLDAGEVQRLNHLGLQTVVQSPPSKAQRPGVTEGDQQAHGNGVPEVGPEIERVFAVAEPTAIVGGHRIHFVGDVFDALLNLRRWNQEMATPEGRALWGRRTVRYFLHDPRTGRFAPAKFCAYLPLRADARGEVANAQHAAAPMATMTMRLYAVLGESERRFDGHRAREHLVRRLAMASCPLSEAPHLGHVFRGWQEQYRDTVKVHPEGPVVLVPPAWFR